MCTLERHSPLFTVRVRRRRRQHPRVFDVKIGLQRGRVVPVNSEDGRQLEGELIVLTGRYRVGAGLSEGKCRKSLSRFMLAARFSVA